jgi:hypothetical protein
LLLFSALLALIAVAAAGYIRGARFLSLVFALALVYLGLKSIRHLRS